jgi:hypothetical protein
MVVPVPSIVPAGQGECESLQAGGSGAAAADGLAAVVAGVDLQWNRNAR